jgi:hypothetical protein
MLWAILALCGLALLVYTIIYAIRKGFAIKDGKAEEVTFLPDAATNFLGKMYHKFQLKGPGSLFFKPSSLLELRSVGTNGKEEIQSLLFRQGPEDEEDSW